MGYKISLKNIFNFILGTIIAGSILLNTLIKLQMFFSENKIVNAIFNYSTINNERRGHPRWR